MENEHIEFSLFYDMFWTNKINSFMTFKENS